ncbi:hypothetical protein FHY55_12190 [Oceanicola sp. D3]|uniref:hypothetical protein n=1 Tax=Oceanicola sp. D3 TaxID=2587163 RepID=UPI001122603E|nr:hypothetical protein [Oceanicola sp. D3]QDC09955.1 hypothetical protein FHY55_12190 [Oceanicola sp. D3]
MSMHNQNGSFEDGLRRVAVLSADPVLFMDLQMMLQEAGFDVVEVDTFESFATSDAPVSSAIVDVGEEPEAALKALMRLSSEEIPHVVLSYEAQDVPLALAGSMLRGTLYKPVCVDELLPLLGQSLPG